MKNCKNLCVAVLAFLSFGLVSCDLLPDKPMIPGEEENYVTVNLALTGEYVELEYAPLETRAESKADIYGIQVYTVTDAMMTTPYAYGVFSSLDNVSIKLLEGSKYKFVAGIIIDADIYDKGDGFQYTNYGLVGSSFEYSTNNILSEIECVNYDFEKVRFYGEITDYSPVEGTSVKIETKRTVYGAHFVAEGLTEGSLEIKVAKNMMTRYTVTLTPDFTESDKVYSFANQHEAWYGTWKTVDELVDYYTTKQLTINWTKADGSIVPMGVYDVEFKRNVRTTVRITVEDVGMPNGIVLTRENAAMVDDENEYVISGGKVTEVPVRDEK